MKKTISVLLLFAIMLPFAVSCHGTGGLAEFVIPESFDENKSYTITFWAKNDTNVIQKRIYNKAVEDFQKLYPNITVNIKFYTDYERLYSDVITNIATKTTPNVCITYPDHIATYLTGTNTVVPLDSLFTDEKYGLGGSEVKYDSVGMDEIISTYLEEGNFGGHYYAIPFMRSTEACYVNKTYVEKLGFTLPETLTWDFVWQVSEAATAKDADGNYLVNGQKVMIPFIYKSTDNMMIQYLKQSGAGYCTDAGELLLFNETTGNFLKEIASHTKSGAFSTFKWSSYPANYLNAGQAIFAVDSTAGATWMGSDAPLLDIAEENLVEFETAVMAIPQCDTENPQMISQGPSVCIFNKDDSGEVLASWLFAQYLLTNDVQIAYSQTEGYTPVTSRAFNSDEYKDYLSRAGEDNETYYDVKIKATKLLLENIENTFTAPVFNGSASLRNAAGMLIEYTTQEVRRKGTVDDAFLQSVYEKVTTLYHLDSLGDTSLGPLPKEAIILLVTLGTVWVCLLTFVIINKIIKRRRKKEAK